MNSLTNSVKSNVEAKVFLSESEIVEEFDPNEVLHGSANQDEGIVFVCK